VVNKDFQNRKPLEVFRHNRRQSKAIEKIQFSMQNTWRDTRWINNYVSKSIIYIACRSVEIIYEMTNKQELPRLGIARMHHAAILVHQVKKNSSNLANVVKCM